MGAATISGKQELGGLGLAQGKRYVRVTIVPSSSYAAGGDTVSHATLGLKNITEMWVLAAGSTDGKAVTAPTIGAFVGLGGTSTARKLTYKVGAGTAAEVSDTTDLDGVTFDVIFGGD